MRAAVARAELARSVAYLETLNQISRVLLIERNRRGVLRLVAEAAARFLRSDTGRVTLLDADEKALVLEAATGPWSRWSDRPSRSTIPCRGGWSGTASRWC